MNSQKRNLGVADAIGAEIQSNELSKGLRKIFEFSAFCNQYFHKKQSWTDLERGKTKLYLCANAVRTLAILLEPYISIFSGKTLAATQPTWYSSETKLELSLTTHILRADTKSTDPQCYFKKFKTKTLKKRNRNLQNSPIPPYWVRNKVNDAKDGQHGLQ